MCARWGTTERENESVAGDVKPRMWLRWVAPRELAPVPLEHDLIIGRDAECQVRLDGNGVSRRHAIIHRQGPLFAIKDLGSTNGTFVNGKRTEHAAVMPGSLLRIGDQIGVFS